MARKVRNSSWLDSQKKVGLVRSRLVVNQVQGACKREDVFAATPPLAAMRFILSRAASCGHGLRIGFWDVSVSFFHSTIEEQVFVRPPKNMRMDKTVRCTVRMLLLHVGKDWCVKHCAMVTGQCSKSVPRVATTRKRTHW